MSPDEYCQQKAARSGSSFYYSFVFLPPQPRRAITALYAFCREVDDIVDSGGDPGVAGTRLAWWADEINRLYDSTPTHPVTRALSAHLTTFGLERTQLLEIIEGMRMDLTQTRYLDFEGLRLYCHRVAGVVGEMASAIFGATDPATRLYAERLGLALQLTNIIRDVGEDARNGRIYLPGEDLQRHEVPAAEILQARHSSRFESLMRFQAERARAAYREAYALLPEVDRRSQRPGLIMAAIYWTLLEEIEQDGFRVLEHRVALTPVRKLWIAWKTWMRGTPAGA
jgi:phytoene synthase